MWYADDVRTRERIPATPDARCRCPLCLEPVIPKCGDLVPWHFAHKADHDCDRWSEPESEWHLAWKQLVTPDRREVVIGNHRADIVSWSGRVVVELQHSGISPEEIHEREQFYRRPETDRWMVWLFDVRDCERRIEARGSQYRDDEALYVWKQARKSIIETTAPTYLDIWDAPEPLVRIVRWLPLKADQVEDTITGQALVENPWPRAFIGRIEPRERFISRYLIEDVDEARAA